MPPLRKIRVKAEPIKEEIVELDNSEPEEVQPEIRRSKRERKPTKYTNLNESALEDDSGCKTPKSKNSKRSEKRKRSDSDSDFNLEDGSSDEDYDDFVDYNEDEEQQTAFFENWRQQNLGDLEVFKTIKSIPQGVDMLSIRKLLSAQSEDLSANGLYEHYLWSLFVNFCKEFRKNPYAPLAADLVNFIYLLKRYGVPDEERKEGQPILLAKINSYANNKITLTDLQGIEAVASNGLVFKLKFWTRDTFFNAFILFCQKPTINQDPFDCDASSVASYLKNCLTRIHKESVFFSAHKILRTIVSSIEFYQISYFDLSVKIKLSEAPEISEFLDIVACADLGIDSLSGYLAQDGRILDLTTDCKYIKYGNTNNFANFWKEKAVTSFLKDVFTKKNDLARCVISPKVASIILGVSLEMIMAHRPKLRYPLVMRAFEKKGSSEIFWTEIPEVVRTMSLVRCRKINFEEGAFQLGVSVADLRDQVGPLHPLPLPSKEVKKIVKPKINPLEKLCEEEDDEMSEYDRIRQKNIRERLSLFNKLGLDSSKSQCVRLMPKKQPAEAIQPRQKSRRVMKQMAHRTKTEQVSKPGVEKSVQTEPGFLHAMAEKRIIPPVSILLEDLSSIEQPLSENLKFLSALDQELKWSEKRGVKSGILKQEKRDEIELKAICTMSTEQILCGAVMPSSDMDLVCTGDKSGSLGIWLVQTNDESGMGPSYANRRSYFHFKTHLDQINSVTFNKFKPSQVISSANDGFIRSIDLASEQVVDVLYKSYNHYHDWANLGICHQDFISASEMIILQTKVTGAKRIRSSAYVFDIRSQNQLLIGQEDIFNCKLVSIHPTNSQLLTGAINNKVVTFDLRQATSPLNEIRFNEGDRPIVAEYSGDGEKMLVSTCRTFNQFKLFSHAVVVDLQHPTVYDDQHFQGAQKLMGKLVNEDRDYLFNRGSIRCVWHPSQEGSIFAVLHAGTDTVVTGAADLNSSSLATIDKDCSATTWDMNFNSHFGLVADHNSKTLLGLNSYDNGTVAFMKF